MAIEFHCPECSKLLSVPDDSEGRQARCPSCSAVCDVPAAASASAESEPTSGESEPESSAESFPSLSPPSENPFEPPRLSGDDLQSEPAAFGEIRHTLVDVGDVLSRSWTIFREQMGMAIAVVVVVYAIQIGFNMATEMVSNVVAMEADFFFRVFMSVILVIAQQLFSLWLSLGLLTALLDISRGKDTEVSKVFSGGRFIGGTFLATLLLMLGYLAFVLVFCGLPALAVFLATNDSEVTRIAATIGGAIAAVPIIYCAIAFSQYQLFIVDRDAGAIESLKMSWEFTKGNKLSLFLLGLVAIGLTIAGTLACCVGLVFTTPFIFLTLTVNYLIMTGQPTSDRTAKMTMR